MKLKAIIGSLDDVEEPFRPLYVPEMKDGKETGRFILEADGIELSENVTGLKNALAAQKTANATLREQAEKLKDINPDEYNRLKREAEQREERERQVAEEASRRIEEAQLKFETDTRKKDERIKELTTRWHDLFIETQVTGAILERKGVPLLLLPHMKPRIRVKEKDGKLSLEILNGEGMPMLGDKGESAKPVDLVKEFEASDTFGRAFDGSGQAGAGGVGGRKGNGQDGKGRNPWAKESWNLTEQGRINRDHPALAKEFMDQAGVPVRERPQPE